MTQCNATLDSLAFGSGVIIQREIVLNILHAFITAPDVLLEGVTEFYWKLRAI